MKNISVTIFALFALGLVACKKDRTCTCTSEVVSQTSTQPNFVSTPDPPTTNYAKYSKVKKSNPAIESCVTSEQTETYTTGQNQEYTITVVNKSTCTVK